MARAPRENDGADPGGSLKAKMFGWFEITLLAIAAALLLLRALPVWRPYRPLFVGGGMLLVITALFPRAGNPLGQFLFGAKGGGPLLPHEIIGVAWWMLSAWLAKSLLAVLLRLTFFPDNDEPHARRLFADLASGLIYILAFVGIVGTVFKQPVSTFLATSGVLAIVLGLALQNTLGDLFAGLAINIDRTFAAGDWISLADHPPGQVMQVNWRATRLRTWTHDIVVIPNSVVTKASVTNHSQPKGPHLCALRLRVDLAVAPSRVIEALQAAVGPHRASLHGVTAKAYVGALLDSVAEYELAFPIDSFATMPAARSDMLARISEVFQERGIPIGAPAQLVRIESRDEPAAGAAPSRQI